MSSSPKKSSPKKAKRPRKPKAPASHPSVEAMVRAAIAALKDRKGSSLVAIKKYVAANNKVDIAKITPHIRRYLKKAVANKTLKQSSGTGASGRFRLGQAPKAKKPRKKAKKPKKKAAKKARKPRAKKAKKPKAAKPKKAKKPKAKAAKAKKPKAAKPKAKKAAKGKAKKA